MRIYLCLIIVNSREFISVKAFTSKLKFLVSTLILTFFFFCWTIIRTRIENKRLLKKKKSFLKSWLSWLSDISIYTLLHTIIPFRRNSRHFKLRLSRGISSFHREKFNLAYNFDIAGYLVKRIISLWQACNMFPTMRLITPSVVAPVDVALCRNRDSISYVNRAPFITWKACSSTLCPFLSLIARSSFNCVYDSNVVRFPRFQ